MKQILFILSLSMLISCGHVHDHVETDEYLGNGVIDTELTTLVSDFEQRYSVKAPNHMSIRIVDSLYQIDNPLVDGVCWTRAGVPELIEVRRERWDNMSEAAQEQLLFHELGHCLLGLDHRNSYGIDIFTGYECPNSIMNKFTFSEFNINNCYLPDRTYYLEELLY